MDRSYIAIDLKSFYASVECREFHVDPLTTNLVVADASRTEKTICLAVTPSLKAYGISGRARLFEVVQRVKEVNADRLRKAPGHVFTGKSSNDTELKANPSLELDYMVATPRMAYYMEYSTRIVSVYLKYVSIDDIHVYSIDEVFIDATDYIRTQQMTAHDFARMMIQDVLQTTGITATAGIGTNLYLAKIAMDIYAKHVPADQDGVRIAELDEMTYRRILWSHRPLTDFWRVGKGISRKLEANNMFTMGDVARMSVTPGGEDLLHKLFGINAELLIDHAWGWESCTIADIKNFKAETKSISVGQVLSEPYGFEQAKMIVREMTDGLVLDLVKKKLFCDQIVLTVGYDISSTKGYTGELEEDRYRRKTPKMAHGSINLGKACSSTKLIMGKTMELYDQIVNPKLLVRRMYVVANHISEEKEPEYEQVDLFSLINEEEEASRKKAEEKEKRLQQAVLSIKNKHGKNAILPGTSYQEGATGRDRNKQIGGHRQ
jgi:DNA polymerase V